jgi:membrane-associated phospholipid phosphatase
VQVSHPPDTSHGFQLGWLKGGVFWGWPSSHTTVAFAMAACLITLHPRNKTFVGLGVSVTIHWFSESGAGGIFGGLIETVVGKSFVNRLINPAQSR